MISIHNIRTYCLEKIMIQRIIFRFFPNLRSKRTVGFADMNPARVLKDYEIHFAENTKDIKGKGPAKEENISIKMPGLVHPETMNEEGYFTQRAKQQLEELKRKVKERPSLTNPEKQNN